ncbi:hypothetical protein AB6D11_02890 [Vibrio splendidus]
MKRIVQTHPKSQLMFCLILGSVSVTAVADTNVPDYMTPTASAESTAPSRKSICLNTMNAPVENYFASKESECITEHQLTTDNRAEETDYWSENPDANCDLGLNFPSLPGFDFNLDGLNSCEILKGVTDEVVKEVNQTTQATVDNVTESVTGDKDGIDVGFDPNKAIVDEATSDLDFKDSVLDSLN